MPINPASARTPLVLIGQGLHLPVEVGDLGLDALDLGLQERVLLREHRGARPGTGVGGEKGRGCYKGAGQYATGDRQTLDPTLRQRILAHARGSPPHEDEGPPVPPASGDCS